MSAKRKLSLVELLRAARDFIEERGGESRTLGPWLRRGRTTAQLIYFVHTGFRDNRCSTRAAALCYTTLLALIPLLAVGLSVAKGFLKESTATVVPQLLDQFVTRIAPQLEFSAEGRQQVVTQIQGFIGNIDAGTLTTVGTVALILVAIRLLMTIEATFNDIWGVRQGRPIWLKVIYYWAAISLGPVALFTAVAFTGRAEFQRALGTIAVIPGAQRFLFAAVPYLILWLGFGALYMLMPNTKVRWRAALAGGIVAGTLWQLNSLLNAMYVSQVVTYNKIYGGLGIIPVFLVGLYLSWVIVLLGAQVCYAVQNRRALVSRTAAERVDQKCRERYACRLVLLVTQRFLRSQPPLAVTELADQLGAPPQVLNQIITRLIEAGVLAETGDDELKLVPARPPETVCLSDVLHILRTHTGTCEEAAPPPGQEHVEELLFGLDKAARDATGNMNYRQLAEDVPPV